MYDVNSYFSVAEQAGKYPMNMHKDQDFWHNLEWPAAPDHRDVEVYQQYCTGSVLLLGSTEILLPLCTDAWDLLPKYPDARIQNRDWLTLDQHYDTIIADAVLCFTREITDQLLPVILKNCDTFITRSFLRPNWETTYAEYFPLAEELTPVPVQIPINEVYTFYLWNSKR